MTEPIAGPDPHPAQPLLTATRAQIHVKNTERLYGFPPIIPA